MCPSKPKRHTAVSAQVSSVFQGDTFTMTHSVAPKFISSVCVCKNNNALHSQCNPQCNENIIAQPIHLDACSNVPLTLTLT